MYYFQSLDITITDPDATWHEELVVWQQPELHLKYTLEYGVKKQCDEPKSFELQKWAEKTVCEEKKVCDIKVCDVLKQCHS